MISAFDWASGTDGIGVGVAVEVGVAVAVAVGAMLQEWRSGCEWSLKMPFIISGRGATRASNS